MTDDTTPRPRFTQRRVIALAVGTAVILTVAGLGFGVFDGDTRAPVTVTILRFDNNRESTDYWVTLLISNRSDWFHYASSGENGPGSVRCRFITDKGFGEPFNPAPKRAGNAKPTAASQGGRGRHVQISMKEMMSMVEIPEFLPGHSAARTQARLPGDGATCRIAVRCYAHPAQWPAYLEKIHQVWLRWFPSRTKYLWAVCDQEIQCPKLLPNGTVEPPRLVSKPGAKP